ncbi:3-keto-5-aminohexanoate cleavage protein [Methylobacter sp.]|uniref:3-keto-5-aminohexanoate cleavage protein n=1 Tax=Methylobacter sp. TaxID=2051955 RepID=UPI002FDEDE7B
MKLAQPLIINLACTGGIPTRSMSPHVPLNHNEIVDDVARCLELGIQMVHLHARDVEGVQTGYPEPYGRLIEAIRKLPGGREALLCVTTTGRQSIDFESRSRILELDGNARPDMASLTLSSHNFVQSASVNEPETIRLLAARMQEKGIIPELEVFDLGMANFIRVLLKEGLLTAPLYVNVLLGNIAGAQADPLHLAAILAALPEDCVVSVAGIGRCQLAANGLGLLFADGVRVGLEDNLWFDQARMTAATNVALVQRVLRLASEFERQLMDRRFLRERLGIGPGSARFPAMNK